MPQTPRQPRIDDDKNIWFSYSLRDRTLLTIGCVLSYWIFSAAASLFSIPRYPGYQGSLMMQTSPLLALVMAIVVFAACVALTSMFAGIVHYEGGLFCGAVGLVALSTHAGPMRYGLMYSPGMGIFPKMMIELIVLFAAAALGWFVLGLLRDQNLLRPEPHGDDDPDALPAQGFMALGAQVVVMTILMLLMAQTDKKAQVIWSVAISAYLAALGAHSLFPSRPSAWFWVTPFIVGMLGYVFAWMGGKALPGGEVAGYLAPLGRPLPADYASVGVAGSLLGYWTSRRWHYERDEEPASPDQVEDALEHPAAG